MQLLQQSKILVFLLNKIKILAVLGCRKLTYYLDNEPKINTLSEELTTKISSKTLRSSYLFGFNGQEKDDEVAGAGNTNTAMFWEYDTRLARRWNLDPVVKEWQSLYCTFSNSPIRTTDINGDDDYTVDCQGNVKFEKKTDDKNDRVIALGGTGKIEYDKKGNMLNQSIIVDKSILNNKRTDVATIKKDGESKKVEFEYFVINGDAKGTELFKFMAKNTNVEWGLTKVGDNFTTCFLSTGKDEFVEPGGLGLLQNEFMQASAYKSYDHNHPDGNGKPSNSGTDVENNKRGGDVGFAKKAEKLFPKVILRVYTAQDDAFNTYNSRTFIMMQYEAPAFEVRPK
jgi:hypothetical protein